MNDTTASEREMRYRESQREKGFHAVRVWVPESRIEDIRQIGALWRGDLIKPGAPAEAIADQPAQGYGSFQHEWSSTKYGDEFFKFGEPIQRAMPEHNSVSWQIIEAILQARGKAHFRTLEAATRGHHHGDKAHQGRGSAAFVRYCMRNSWIVPVDDDPGNKPENPPDNN